MIDPQFLRALIHRLRTPLSVVASDLEYIEKKFPEAEAKRTIRNTQRIADMLSSVESILDATSLGSLKKVCESFNEVRTIILDSKQWQFSVPTFFYNESFEGILIRESLKQMGAVVTMKPLPDENQEILAIISDN
jgi:hypothetical protein